MGLGPNLVVIVVITHGRLITHVDYDSAPNLFSQEPRALGRVPANIDSIGTISTQELRKLEPVT